MIEGLKEQIQRAAWKMCQSFLLLKSACVDRKLRSCPKRHCASTRLANSGLPDLTLHKAETVDYSLFSVMRLSLIKHGCACKLSVFDVEGRLLFCLCTLKKVWQYHLARCLLCLSM